MFQFTWICEILFYVCQSVWLRQGRSCLLSGRFSVGQLCEGANHTEVRLVHVRHICQKLRKVILTHFNHLELLQVFCWNLILKRWRPTNCHPGLVMYCPFHVSLFDWTKQPLPEANTLRLAPGVALSWHTKWLGSGKDWGQSGTECILHFLWWRSVEGFVLLHNLFKSSETDADGFTVLEH